MTKFFINAVIFSTFFSILLFIAGSLNRVFASDITLQVTPQSPLDISKSGKNVYLTASVTGSCLNQTVDFNVIVPGDTTEIKIAGIPPTSGSATFVLSYQVSVVGKYDFIARCYELSGGQQQDTNRQTSVLYDVNSGQKVPDPPTNLHTTHITDTTATLEWDPPVSGLASTYNVTYGPSAGGGSVQSVDGVTDAFKATSGLTPNTRYNFTVSGCSPTGCGPAAPADFTTQKSGAGINGCCLVGQTLTNTGAGIFCVDSNGQQNPTVCTAGTICVPATNTCVAGGGGPPPPSQVVQQTCNTDVVSNPSYPLAKCSDLESKHYIKDGTSQSCTANGKDGRGCSTIGDSLCKVNDGDNPTKYLCYKPLPTTSGSQPCDPGTDKVYTDPTDPNYSKATGVYTAIGCVPTQPQDFIPAVIKFVTLIAGGIALLLMAIGAIRMITSAGNAEALKAAQEQFTSAIIGLLFIIFSVLLLQIIGVDILNIPGFGKS